MSVIGGKPEIGLEVTDSALSIALERPREAAGVSVTAVCRFDGQGEVGGEAESLRTIGALKGSMPAE